jgi:hypothetical protein
VVAAFCLVVVAAFCLQRHAQPAFGHGGVAREHAQHAWRRGWRSRVIQHLKTMVQAVKLIQFRP